MPYTSHVPRLWKDPEPRRIHFRLAAGALAFLAGFNLHDPARVAVFLVMAGISLWAGLVSD